MKFDFAIGNPPYQQESRGANANDTPVYQFFYEAAYQIANKVELITPARFLFNAGGTPKEWNEKMLKDKHVKVLEYTQKSSDVFANTDIKGGVAITYRDVFQDFGAIETYSPYNELNSIKTKVAEQGELSLMSVVTNRGLYKWSNLAYVELPEEMKLTADSRVAPSSFERMSTILLKTKPEDGNEYIQIYGNVKAERMFKWVRKSYITEVSNLFKFKVLVPKANGSGALGETLSNPVVCGPQIGFTETYISIGETDSENEALAVLKYIKTKFARVMLGILKVTQNNAKPVWKYVPLQDFSSNSDIDWSKSIADIDQQLYDKYELSPEERTFIETHVKEME